jgi:hypothetical protein
VIKFVLYDARLLRNNGINRTVLHLFVIVFVNFYLTMGNTLFRFLFFILYYVSGFGGLEVACWPLVPKFARSNPSSARLPSEGK